MPLPVLLVESYNPAAVHSKWRGILMAHLNQRFLIALVSVVITCGLQSAMAAEPPADLCSLLPAADLSKALGQAYDAPQKTVAPRPFANTNEGADCTYKRSKDPRGAKLLFRAYADPSPSAAAGLFARLSMFYAPPKPVSGVGDQAYFDKSGGLHVLKGKVRFFLALDNFTAANEKQLTDVARQIAGRL